MDSQDAVVAMVLARCSLGHSALRDAWHPGRRTLATKGALPGGLSPMLHRMVLQGVSTGWGVRNAHGHAPGRLQCVWKRLEDIPR